MLSTLLFNCYMDQIVRNAMETMGGGLHIQHTTAGRLFLTYRVKTTGASWIQGIQYADDLSLIAENRVHPQRMMNVLDSTCLKWGMTISAEQTKVLSVGGQV